VVSGPGINERLIPFVPAYIDRIDVAERRIDVDWEVDY
jgi:ribosomal 30S subunit maturation factor RimM